MGSALLEGLNTPQQTAVTADDGPVLIVAGPGTGKTRTLTTRIAWLITTGRAKPEAILALTFTKKAAAEMQQRVRELVPGEQPRIATFHALFHELLNSETPFVQEPQRLQIIRNLPRPKALKALSVRELGLAISCAKNQTVIDDPDIAKVVKVYNKALAEQELRDFDDLLQEAHQRLTADTAFREDIQQRYSYLLVDEFQDTNLLQYELLKLLAAHDNLFVIGDPQQSIYGFRGASGTIFSQFKADFPQSTEIALTDNYRSVPEVVQLANAIFPDSPDLQARHPAGGQARAVQVLNEYSEAEWVLREIQRAIGGGDFLRAVSDDHRSQHRQLSDFAVLYRSRSAAAVFQKLLAESGLPYQVAGDGSPYDQPQIQAILTLLREAVSDQPLTLEGFGSAQRHLLEAELTKVDEAVPHALVGKLIAILGFELSLELQQFSSVLVRFRDVSSVLAHFDTIAEHGFYDPAAEAITLLTIHAAKGLEFPHIFLLGAEDGILPADRGDPAEERRLFYVAVTRARERLDILHTKNRGGQPTTISRFMTGLPAEALNRQIDPDMEAQIRRLAKRAAKKSQTSLF